MTKRELDELKEITKETVEQVAREKFDGVILALEMVKKTVDRAVQDLDTDRVHLGEMAKDTAAVKEGNNQILQQLHVNNKKVTDKITDAAEATIESAAASVAEAVEPVMAEAARKMKNNIPLTRKKPWWKFW